MGNSMSASIGMVQARIKADAEALSLAVSRPAPQPEDASGSLVSFSESFQAAIRGVDDKDRAAAEKMAAVDSGRSDDLVGAMLASQEASLSFSMLMQARNKLVGAMEDLIKLQL